MLAVSLEVELLALGGILLAPASRDHPCDRQCADTRRHLRQPERRARGQRRRIYPDCQSRRGNGTGHQCWGCNPGPTGWPAAPASEPEGGDRAGADKASEPKKGSASEAKAVNDAIAYIRSASLSAQAALAQNVIDLVARDSTDLLAQLNGRSVRVGTGEISGSAKF